jgi:ABC-type molybdate transport system substrate-binding protein
MSLFALALVLLFLSVILWLAGLTAGEKGFRHYQVLHVLSAASFSAALVLGARSMM